MSKKGTSTDLPAPKVKVDQAAADAFRLDIHLVSLMFDEPFFCHVLRGVNMVKTRQIPTAGVLAKDTELTMWWNPDFLASLTKKQVKGLLKHEAYHLALNHTTTRRMEPHIIHNYATDLAINSDIARDELPEGGLIPGEALKMSPEQAAKLPPDVLARFERISAKIASFPPKKSAEWYFGQLMDDPDIVKDIEQQNSAGGKSLAKALADGDVSIDENGNIVDKDGNIVTVTIGGPIDDHEGWDDMSDEDRQIIEGKVKAVLADAVRRADSNGQWGSVGAEMRTTLRKMVTNEVDWKQVLKRFVGFSRRGTRRTSWTRLSKKYGGRVAGVKRGYTSSIAVYIDQSGSVDTASLELAFGELYHLAKHTEFTTYHFDTAVDLDSETVWTRGKSTPVLRTRCGGTCFEAPTDHANANKHRFDGFLIITDGEAPKPKASKIRRGWMIIPNRTPMFTPASTDFVINMKHKEKDD